MLADTLKKGDTIGIVAPSKVLDERAIRELENFEKYIQEQGFKIKRSKHLLEKEEFNTSAGTPEQRAEDINTMFSDKNIKAIWFFQGGETANQTLELIDFENIKKNPKIMLGKSDVDVLFLAIYKKTGLIGFHFCDSKIGRNREMDFEYTKEWFERRLTNKEKSIEPTSERKCIREGSAEGKILGCNVTSILKLAGTEYFPDFSGAILLLEAYKSNPGKVIYQITQLKHLGVLEKVKGIIVGHNFEFEGGKEEITIEEIVKALTTQTPILKIGEFGHYQPHACIPIGAKGKMDATNKTFEITEEFLN
jgi:muramoyltetrapeptide carboxypeptidase